MKITCKNWDSMPRPSAHITVGRFRMLLAPRATELVVGYARVFPETPKGEEWLRNNGGFKEEEISSSYMIQNWRMIDIGLRIVATVHGFTDLPSFVPLVDGESSTEEDAKVRYEALLDEFPAGVGKLYN